MSTVNLELILSIIAIITGLIALAGFVYTNAIWRGKIETKVDTLWKVFMEESMRTNPEYATHNSPLTLTKYGYSIVEFPELNIVCDIILLQNNINKMSVSDVVEKITKSITIERLKELSVEKEVTLPQLISMIVLKCGKKL